jgi:NAD(P)-dependent dehydrogenase (short-subunit alcohol dehydrogenase family)
MPSKLFDLSDRTCLVTGSARGLGNALAEGLAEAGATVVLNSLNPERLSSAAAFCGRRVTPFMNYPLTSPRKRLCKTRLPGSMRAASQSTSW